MDTAIESKQQPQPVAQRPRHVHTITDRFSMANTYVIDDGQLVVVDPGSELNVQQLLIYLRDFLRRDPTEIDLVALTNLHPDHTAGVGMLRRASHAPVAASIVAKWLSASDTDEAGREGRNFADVVGGTSVFVGSTFSQVRLSGTLHRLDNFTSHYERLAHLVDLWIEDVHGLPGHPDWRVIASPGQTPESLCFYNPFSYELICGDILITLDGGTILVRGGANRHRLQQTIQTLQSLNVYYLYPGHGRPILAQRALARVEW